MNVIFCWWKRFYLDWNTCYNHVGKARLYMLRYSTFPNNSFYQDDKRMFKHIIVRRSNGATIFFKIIKMIVHDMYDFLFKLLFLWYQANLSCPLCIETTFLLENMSDFVSLVLLIRHLVSGHKQVYLKERSTQYDCQHDPTTDTCVHKKRIADVRVAILLCTVLALVIVYRCLFCSTFR